MLSTWERGALAAAAAVPATPSAAASGHVGVQPSTSENGALFMNLLMTSAGTHPMQGCRHLAFSGLHAGVGKACDELRPISSFDCDMQ